MRALEKFNMNMKYYRELSGLSQGQLAQKLNVSRSVITRLETGEQEPTLSYLLSLSHVFSVSIDHLIGRDQQANEIIHEGSRTYHVDHSLFHIIDYLMKQPKMAASLQQLLFLKTKKRKFIEQTLITLIENSIKLSD
jgi:transcriptional regulator with XRE-family HTH domain